MTVPYSDTVDSGENDIGTNEERVVDSEIGTKTAEIPYERRNCGNVLYDLFSKQDDENVRHYRVVLWHVSLSLTNLP